MQFLVFPEQNNIVVKHPKIKWEYRFFPDDEIYIRIFDKVEEEVVIVCSFDHPNTKTLACIFAASALKEMGAKKVHLWAPYIGYMRQDKVFNEGEVLTSKIYGELMSRYFDSVQTIDPHLHRYKHMSEVYKVPGASHTAMPLVQEWIRKNINNPYLVGPDSESGSLILNLAKALNCPYAISHKKRYGDEDVEIEINVPEGICSTTEQEIVIVDDIISSGITMLTLIDILRKKGCVHITCIGVHGIFARGVYEKFLEKNVRILTTNTIAHESNEIDISQIIAESSRL